MTLGNTARRPPSRELKASERIYRSIESGISEGALLPGDPVDEEELMAQFGVSRTPVREALLQLKTVGLLDGLPRGGAIVAKLSGIEQPDPALVAREQERTAQQIAGGMTQDLVAQYKQVLQKDIGVSINAEARARAANF